MGILLSLHSFFAHSIGRRPKSGVIFHGAWISNKTIGKKKGRVEDR
jgi:hypothetical protein